MHPPTNDLIGLLPSSTRTLTEALCETVELKRGDAVPASDQGLHYAYFPVESCISLVMQVDGRSRIEVGVIGREGMLGPDLPLGVSDAPLMAVVHRTGSTLRMRGSDFVAHSRSEPSFGAAADGYLQVLFRLMAAAAACVHFHMLQPRLAKWLLMSRDRTQGDRFEVTHQVLAQVLGVRRAGVTVAARALQDAGLIEYHRGSLTILDLAGLRAASCSCYAADQLAYSKLVLDRSP